MRNYYDDDVSTSDQFLGTGKSFCKHHQNIQSLLNKVYMTLYDNSGNSLKELLVKRESNINLRYKPELAIPSVNSFRKI